jgi:hypothetical protein
MGDDQKPQDEAGPEEGLRKGAVPGDDDDVEGHGKRWSAIPDDNKPGPDEAVRLKAIPDEDDAAPGPDGSRLSDRTRKVGIVPVTWD